MIQRVDALFAKPLAFRRPPSSPESQNTEDHGHQETPKMNFSRNMQNSKFQDKDSQKFKKELSKYDCKDHRGIVILINKMDGIFE